MPMFSTTGHDLFVCQFCGRDCDSGVETPTWIEGRGNKCERCMARGESKYSIKTHNGKLTFHNSRTGEHRTFQVKTQDADAKFAPGERIVSLLVGNDNQNDYRGFGVRQRVICRFIQIFTQQESGVQ